MDKEKISEKYFDDTKPKHLRDFTATTPQGNIITGVICKKPNRFLGSMLITEITLKEKDVTFETEQFIQAMPKIHYYDYHHEMYVEEQIGYPIYEKLDGTCLILFGLYYNNEVIEIVPKTRGLPVADSHILDMFGDVEKCNIESFFEDYKDLNPTLIFELFGALNQHSIFYPSVRIDIRLIGGSSCDGQFIDWYDMRYLCHQYDFVLPCKIFSIVFYKNSWKIRVMPGMFYYYLFDNCSDDEVKEVLDREYPTQLDVVQGVKAMITRINKNYSARHGRQLLEGGVINTYNSLGESFMYIKVKSADIEEKCRTENGVPRKFILKEVHKYFDEYGSQAKEIYVKDENHYKEYVNRNLLEEFDMAAVEMRRTQSRITNVFLDMLEAKEPPKGLQDICSELVEKYPNTDVSDLMRLFAQEYPEKKRYARMAYGIFESLLR